MPNDRDLNYEAWDRELPPGFAEQIQRSFLAVSRRMYMKGWNCFPWIRRKEPRRARPKLIDAWDPYDWDVLTYPKVWNAQKDTKYEPFLGTATGYPHFLTRAMPDYKFMRWDRLDEVEQFRIARERADRLPAGRLKEYLMPTFIQMMKKLGPRYTSRWIGKDFGFLAKDLGY